MKIFLQARKNRRDFHHVGPTEKFYLFPYELRLIRGTFFNTILKPFHFFYGLQSPAYLTSSGLSIRSSG